MDMGILSCKLINHTHCGDFILYTISYIRSILSHEDKIITTTHCFWSTSQMVHSMYVRSIYTPSRCQINNRFCIMFLVQLTSKSHESTFTLGLVVLWSSGWSLHLFLLLKTIMFAICALF